MDVSIPQSNIGKGHNRFPLGFYYRVANQLVNQAKAYRDGGNIHQLYNTLDKYCRLSEVIPHPQNYTTHSTKEKLHHKKICQEFVEERETLKPLVGHDSLSQKIYALSNITERKVKNCGMAETRCESLMIINEEKAVLPSVYLMGSDSNCSLLESVCPTSMAVSKGPHITAHSVTQTPSPVLSYVENAPQDAHVSHIPVADPKQGQSKSRSVVSKVLEDVHISAQLMEDFLELARDNTEKDLETCGVLGAFLERGTIYVTTLIIPKQESTSSTCQAINEEEIFAIQNEQSLFPVGWIHTHPSQSCFMSSIDLHTHYPYQVMVPEAFAIVLAPTDTSRNYGIFRLSDPAGMSTLKECKEEGFHSHEEPEDGSPIYEHCTNVYTNPNLRFEIFDLR